MTAKKERRKRACKEIVSICMRTLVQNQIKTDSSMFEDLIRSKARECEVERESLPSLSVFLEDIQSKVLETEFIPHDTKENLLKEIGSLQDSVKGVQPTEMIVESKSFGILGSSLFAIMAVAVLTLLAVYSSSTIFNAIELPLENVFTAIGISLLSIMAVAIAYWSISKGEGKETEKKSQTVRGDRGI